MVGCSSGTSATVDREYGYDRASNRTFERRLDDLNLVDRYSYDSAYRVIASAYDQEGAAGAQQRPTTGTSYRYDGVGNRVETTDTLLGSGGGGGGSGPTQALLASESLSLATHAEVQGDVAAASQQVLAIDLASHAHMTGTATGPQVRLQSHARVDGAVSASSVDRHSTATIGGGVVPYVAPPAVPGIQAITPGVTPVTVAAQQTLALAPGSYGNVVVRHHGRLILSAGTYTLGSLVVEHHSVIDVRGAITVRVAGDLSVDHHVDVVLASGLGPQDVAWETLDPTVTIGQQSLFVGRLLAPNSQVLVYQHTTVSGSVQALRVSLGAHSLVVGSQGGGGGGGPTPPSTATTSYTVNQLNEYTSVGGVARGHDPNGNLRDDGTRLFLFDYRNRLIGVSRKSDGAPIAAYRYDALGRRIEKAVYSQTSPGAVEKVTRFYWDGWDLIEEQSAAGITESTYVGGVGVDEHVQWVRTASHPLGVGTFYLHQDARGSVVAVTDQSGAVVDKVRYDDFGPADHASAVGLALGFQGRYLDAETGLYDFRHRVYDAATGRFLQRDPVWDPGNFGGQYTFVGNGPVSRVDPLGLDYQFLPSWEAIKSGVVGVGRAIAEPALILFDVGQAIGGRARAAYTGNPEWGYAENQQFVSGLGSRLNQNIIDGGGAWSHLRAAGVTATALPTGGGSVLVDNIATVYEKDLNPQQASDMLWSGAITQTGVAGTGVAVSKVTGSGWTGRGQVDPAADQALINSIVEARATWGFEQQRQITIARGQQGESLTDPLSSLKQPKGQPAIHAEPRVLDQMGPVGAKTVAVDQIPCPECAPMFGSEGMFGAGGLGGAARVIVPENPLTPGGAPKATASRASRGLVEVRPRNVLNVQFKPPFGPLAQGQGGGCGK